MAIYDQVYDARQGVRSRPMQWWLRALGTYE